MKTLSATNEVSYRTVPIRASPAVSSTVPSSIQRLYRPVRLTTWPMPIDAASSPITIGSVSRPDAVGVWPRPSCMYWLRKTEVPNIADAHAALAITDSTSGAAGEQVRRQDRLGRPRLGPDRAAPAAPPRPAPAARVRRRRASRTSCPASDTQTSSVETPVAISAAPR